MYDYLIVGAGLYGSVFVHEAKKNVKSVLVIDKHPNIAGNIYTEKIEGINFHKYGEHIIHTNNVEVWNYLQQFATFNRFANSPIANYKGELYSLPFNMYTFNKMWGVVTPDEPYYPVNDDKNSALYAEYKKLADKEEKVVFGGRLGEYKYYDMDATVESVLRGLKI